MAAPAAHEERASIEAATSAAAVDAAAAEIETTRAGEPPVKLQWGQVVEIDDSYLRASAFTRFWRSVLFQMILFGA
ncbi:hypothetical protein V496_05440, partial [Pseudogymnoascus sp. VKM F-4515 (FW-2607)]